MSTEQQRRRGIIAGGNWIIDHVKLIDTWPPQDALVTILSESSSNGGSPYNILKDLARLGATFPLEAIGLVGDDADGRTIIEDCRAHRIDTTQMQMTSQAATSYTDVMTVRGTGRRTFFHQRGANALLDVEHFDFAKTRAKIFHLGYLLLLDRLDAAGSEGNARAGEVLARARQAGLKTSIDVVSEDSDRFARVVLPVLSEVDYLFLNDFEAERLTGISLREGDRVSPAAIEQAARSLIDAGVREWVVLHFPEAVYARSRGGEDHWQPSVKVPANDIRGAAGAGDALAAGVLHGLHEEWSIAKSAELGVCAAAAALYHPTCSEGLRSIEECLALGRRLGFRERP